MPKIKNVDMEDIKQRYQKLVADITHYDQKYYQDSDPEISDSEYDGLRSALEIIELQYPDIRQTNSPTMKVGFKLKDGFTKVRHKTSMLSLSNAFSFADLEAFIKRIQKFLNVTFFPEICAEPKIDGVSFSALYKNGKLILGATRGDGVEGEDITENLHAIDVFPKFLQGNYPDLIEVRGEIYMGKKDFIILNEKQAEIGGKIFANPRNSASGSLRQLDPAVTKARALNYFVYQVIDVENIGNGQYEVLQSLESYGFKINPLTKKFSDLDFLYRFYEDISENRYELDYDIDGMVYKVNDISLQKRLGYVARSPRHSIAHKFPAVSAQTKLLDITVQVGRTGALTPVAELEPINIGGVVVARASLHNEDEIIRKDIRIGDVVTVERAGDVIPKVTSSCSEKRNVDLQQFSFPVNCPVCGALATRGDDEVVRRCIGGIKCNAQKIASLKHFVSRKAFDIEGLGIRQIELFCQLELITNYLDIFTLESRQKESLTRIENLDGFGDKSINNLFAAIRERRIISLERFLFALGIRHVGENTAKLLAKNFVSYANFKKTVDLAKHGDFLAKAEFTNIDGLGEKATDAILIFYSDSYLYEMLVNLEEQLDIEKYADDSVESEISGKIIVFTGALIKQTRNEAKARAEKLGAKVASAISGNTDFVVAGDAAGSKLEKAKGLGVKVISEEEWINLI